MKSVPPPPCAIAPRSGFSRPNPHRSCAPPLTFPRTLRFLFPNSLGTVVSQLMPYPLLQITSPPLPSHYPFALIVCCSFHSFFFFFSPPRQGGSESSLGVNRTERRGLFFSSQVPSPSLFFNRLEGNFHCFLTLFPFS